MVLAWGWLLPAHASEPLTAACTPQLLGVWAAQEHTPMARPAADWEAVTLPDEWRRRWPDWHGVTWYRLDWQVPCSDAPLALLVSSIRMAGMVYWDDQLLWRDRQLSAPYSNSFNMPRSWPVTTLGGSGVHSAWIRVNGQVQPLPGLGEVMLGDAMQLSLEKERRVFRQRTVYIITASLSFAIALVALTIWLWRRSERIYLWFGLMEFFWTGYLVNLLRLEPWPWISNSTQNLLLCIFFMLYANSFMLFTQRFLDKDHRRINAGAWCITATLSLCLFFTPYAIRLLLLQLALLWAAVLFNGSALYAIFCACRTRRPAQVWLACCWAIMMVAGLHDIVVALQFWYYYETWSYISGPLTTVFLAGLLGWKVAGYMRRIDGFNLELHANVSQARAELAEALELQQRQAVENAKLQERAQIAHDLHDGLGGNLVRSMALLERAPTLSKDRVLSLFKVLRDDLRQVIDTGSSSTAPVPETPRQWLAPLSHRLSTILDELDILVRWQLDDERWKTPPTAIQCLAMARFMEETFSNIIKHSRARHVRVVSTQPCDISWQVVVEDDGVGFDVATASAARLGIGMQSMRARLARTNGSLEIQSQPGRTVLTAHMLLGPSA